MLIPPELDGSDGMYKRSSMELSESIIVGVRWIMENWKKTKWSCNMSVFTGNNCSGGNYFGETTYNGRRKI
jgi:hypothetical protein